jgi:hypothetical protein
LFRVADSGGPPVVATQLDVDRKEDAHYWPQFLPDGRHFLYFGRSAVPDNNGIFLAQLSDEGKTARGVLIKSTTTQGCYASAAGGGSSLLFMNGRTLQSQNLDLAGSRVSGEPSTIAEAVGVRQALGLATFSVSQSGDLVYATEIDETTRLDRFDREGRRSEAFPTADLYRFVAISPDQKIVALERTDPQSGTTDIWLLDTARRVMTHFAADPRFDVRPVWSPDGRQIAFGRDRPAPINLFRKAVGAAGEPERLTQAPLVQYPEDWTPDGNSILFEQFGERTGWDLFLLPVRGGIGNAVPALQTEFNEWHAAFSSDGHYIAYASDETGRNEVYVQTFPDLKRRWQVTSDGGDHPRWRRDTRELFFLALHGTVMSVSASLPEGRFGLPQNACGSCTTSPVIGSRSRSYDVAADGHSILVLTAAKNSGTDPLTVILNWQSR